MKAQTQLLAFVMLLALLPTAGCADAPTGTVGPPAASPPVPPVVQIESCDGVACPACHTCEKGRCVEQEECADEHCELGAVAGVVADPTHGAFDLAIVEGYLVVSTAVGVEVYAPQEASFADTPVETFVLTGHGKTLVVDGTRAAVAHGTSITLLDVSDPTDLQWLASAEFAEPVLGIDMDGDRMAVGLGNHLQDDLPEGAAAGLVQLFRWEGPHGVPVADAVPIDGPANDVRLDLAADRVFVAAGAIGLVVVDFTGTPEVTSELAFDHPALRVKRWEDKLLVAADRSGLRVVQELAGVLSEVGAFKPTTGSAVIVTDVVMRGNLAVVGARYHWTLQLVDLSNPVEPLVVGAVDTDNGGTLPQRLVLGLDDSVWLSGAGVQECNIADTTAPTFIGRLGARRFPSVAVAVSSDGSTAYVAGGGGLRVIGNAATSTPDVIAEVTFDHPVTSVAATERYVFAGLNATVPIVLYGKLAVVDVADPGKPLVTGVSPKFSGRASSLVVMGDVVFVAAGHVLRFDVSDPTNPELQGSLTSTAGAGAMALHGTTLAVAKHYGPVKLFDVASPSDPKLLGVVPDVADARMLSAANGVLTVGTFNDGTILLGIENPLEPQHLATIIGPGNPLAVASADNKLWIASPAGISLYDVSDSGRPIVESVTPTVGEGPRGLAVSSAIGAPNTVWTTGAFVPLSHHTTTCGQ